ncbi:class I SAM-dependent methyltransferase [Chondromyces crocatus]|uniref:Methyltransferase domain-containing protein n=1 Tax=Chondromyces crocatus TaxID=52 RepID=A0A0K1EC20_CHOCO|nr:class I SAM-dependent methyltransferase [Chondromyces crocatus]AKT38404.1 uncharacterized protein CMC5_025500 [Chondromyces crocatus]
MYHLFNELAHSYDLHTPPENFQHDHAFVLEEARSLGTPCRLLDVGCGTGALLEKARNAGILATGIDASPKMVELAQARVGQEAVTLRRMEEIDEEGAYDLVVSLCWTIHYSAGRAGLLDVLKRIHRALRPGGRGIIQIAHAAHAPKRTLESRIPGPNGEPDDVVMLFRFRPAPTEEPSMHAEYVYACKSLNELLYENHLLSMTDAHAFAACAREAGFAQVTVYDSSKRAPFSAAPNPLVCVEKAHDVGR